MKTNSTFYFRPLLISILTGSLFLGSCTKDEDPILPPEVQMSVESAQITINLDDTLHIRAIPSSNSEYNQEWKLDGEVVSTADTIEFIPSKSGDHMINYRAHNSAGEFTATYAVLVNAKAEPEAPIRPITDKSNMYVTDLFDYLPAPGQFMNKAPGNLESAKGILGGKGMVSLGAWGGSIVLGFDHTVINKEGEDIIIYNNATGNFAEPGIIYVMQDENGNGKPDDTWYEVAGSEFGNDGYIRDYSVTYTRPNPATADVPWKDNQGKSGVVATNAFHKQSYFPEWIEGNEYTITGSVLSSRNIDMTNPSYITSAPFEHGYADNTQGGDKIDISNAVDKEGEKVTLKGIDFIKIQTGIQANMGWLGELSTEVLGVADIRLVK
jgi:hypothetical protein